MGEVSKEIGDILEEAEEVTERLEEDFKSAFGVSFDVSVQNINPNHHQGTAVNFSFQPDTEELYETLNDASDGRYEGMELQNAGGINLHFLLRDN